MADLIPLYRFLDSDAALKTLVAGKFRVGLVSKFNDPFEWKLGFTGIITPQEKEFSETFPRDHIRDLETWMGILSFSRTVSDPTLWSLYADRHSGVAFEVVCPWKDDDLIKMKYRRSRPVLDFSRLRNIHDEKERDRYLLSLLDGLMRQKWRRWIWEQEYRVHININDHRFCQFADGRHHWQIPRESLKQVVLGFCCLLEEAAVRKLLDMNGFVETRVVRARMCPETYAIKMSNQGLNVVVGTAKSLQPKQKPA